MTILNKYKIFTSLVKFHRMMPLLKSGFSQFTAFFSRSTNNIFIHPVFQSRVTPSCSVFLSKVPIIRLNTTYISSTRVFYCTLHVSAVQIRHHSVDFGYTKRNLKGEMLLFLSICSVQQKTTVLDLSVVFCLIISNTCTSIYHM